MRYPNLPPQALAPDLWELRGTWANAFGRRMTVMRLGDKLAVHNALELDEQELAWLRSLGEVTWIIAPNKFHCSDAPWMARAFPRAQLFAPASKLEAFRAQGLKPFDLNKDFPALPGLHCIPMRGTRIEEAAFFHQPSRTLILCDLAFNMKDEFRGLEKVFMRWNKVGVRFGPTRLTRLLFTKSRAELLASYEALLALDFDRVVVNHGEVLATNGRALLRESVKEILA